MSLRPLACFLAVGLGLGCASTGPKPPKATPPEEDPRVLQQLGDSAMSRRAFSEALGYYQKSLSIDGGNSLVHNKLGLSLFTLDRNAEAEQSFRKALEINPDFADARCNLALALARNGDRAGAKAELHRATQAPGYTNVHSALYNLGKIQLEDGEYEPAAEGFRKACERMPNFLAACLGLGVALQKLGRLPEACSQLEKLGKTYGNDCDVRYYLATCLYEQKRYDESMPHFAKVIEMCPGGDPAKKAGEYLRMLRER